MMLYKYYPCDIFTFKALANNGLWCNPVNETNDPHESLKRGSYMYSEEEMKQLKAEAEGIKDQLDGGPLPLALSLGREKFSEFRTEMRRETLNGLTFSSLSETPDSMLMWSHYAAQHNGCVVGIEFNENHRQLAKVTYADELRKQTLTEMATSFLEEKKPEAERNYHVLLGDLSVKARAWSYEKEWRFWANNKGYFYYEPSAVKEIYVGCNSPQEDLVVTLSKVIDNFSNVKLFQMGLPSDSTKLVAFRV